MTELERVELANGRAYVTDHELVHEKDGWMNNERTTIPLQHVTCVQVKERGSWTWLGSTILFGWTLATSIVLKGFLDDPGPWLTTLLIASAALTLVSMVAFLTTRLISVQIDSPNRTLKIASSQRNTTNVKSLARATAHAAGLKDATKTSQATERPSATT